MHPIECYRVLGLPRHAPLEDVKVAYRRLARKYHPDLNPDNPTAAEKFQRVQQAYQILKNAESPSPKSVDPPKPAPPPPQTTAPPPKVQIHVKTAPPRPVVPPEERLRQEMVHKIEDLLRQKKYVVAIPIAEGLRARFPEAPEVARLLAIVYYRHGSECLIAPKSRLREAESYLRKALATDPKNRELKFEIERDLERLKRLKQIEQDLAGLQRHRGPEAS